MSADDDHANAITTPKIPSGLNVCVWTKLAAKPVKTPAQTAGSDPE
ncbi:MAG: hypothetical protein QXL42_04750 [Candidatus Caldarchaeum sp.]